MDRTHCCELSAGAVQAPSRLHEIADPHEKNALQFRCRLELLRRLPVFPKLSFVKIYNAMVMQSDQWHEKSTVIGC